ncbi:perlucin-like protein [Asterias amurensis]|uniref:perlucin-like protein n=1 Tax=Asterias amurensis TaxID=7602 RepID=UPI003AB53A25
MGGFCLPSVLLILFTIGMSSANSCKPQMLCPSGWESWGGSCYKLLEGTMTWHEGRLKCQELGGEMVAPSSSVENNYIQRKAKGNSVWINCNDEEIEGQWDCTSSNGGYMNWYTVEGEPNGGTGENCAELVFLDLKWGGGWNDNECPKAFHIICKGNEVKLKQWRLLASCLTGHALREIPTSSVHDCATVCDYDPRCRSFNVQHFGNGKRICQLNNSTRFEADHTQFMESKNPFKCIYGER